MNGSIPGFLVLATKSVFSPDNKKNPLALLLFFFSILYCIVREKKDETDNIGLFGIGSDNGPVYGRRRNGISGNER